MEEEREKTMTKDEFIEKYGDTLVEFDSYYKYSFCYKGQLPDGKKILCTCGGISDEIYRHKVSAGECVMIALLYPISGSVYDENGEMLECFDEW